MPTATPVAPCKVCERGMLSRQRIHRLGGPAVVIGYIFLIPSVLGIAFSVLMFVLVIAANPHSNGSSDAASIIGGGIFVVTGVFSFLGGLVGWLLVMKKNVLQCSNCMAVVNAS